MPLVSPLDAQGAGGPDQDAPRAEAQPLILEPRHPEQEQNPTARQRRASSGIDNTPSRGSFETDGTGQQAHFDISSLADQSPRSDLVTFSPEYGEGSHILDDLDFAEDLDKGSSTGMWKLWLLISIASLLSAMACFFCSVLSNIISRSVRELYAKSDVPWQQFLIRLVLQTSIAVAAYVLAIYLTAPSAKKVGAYIGGSGIPELKCELGGVHLTGMFSARILFAKLFGLSLATGAGLPVGSEGPFVHLAGCMGYVCMNWIPVFRSIAKDTHLQHVTITTMVSVGVACAFSAPVGGVLYALEVTEAHGSHAYIPCFFGATIAGVANKFMKSFMPEGSWFFVEQLLECDLDPFPFSYKQQWYITGHFVLWYIVVGMVCGLVGALFVNLHRRWVRRIGRMVAWAGRAPTVPSSPEATPSRRLRRRSTVMLTLTQKKWQDNVQAIMTDGDDSEQTSSQPPPPLEFRKKLFMACLVAGLAALNSCLTWQIPLLNQGQAMILRQLSDAESLCGTDGSPQMCVPGWNEPTTVLVSLAVKFLMTVLVLGLPLPMGSIAPTLVLGALVGRLFGWFIIDVSEGGFLASVFPDVIDNHGERMDLAAQMIGRFTLIGATSMAAGAMRSFAQVVLVYALTGLPDMLLPLCISSLAAIFVANYFELGFFDSVILVKKLPHLKALATGKDKQTVFDVMQRHFPTLPDKASAEEVEEVRSQYPLWPNEIPVVTRLEGDGQHSMVTETPVLLRAVRNLPDLAGFSGSEEVMNQQAEVPLQVPPHTELKALLPIFQLLNKTVAFVCEDGHLIGAVTLQDLKFRLSLRT